jgi:hypothetical protein
MVTKGFGAIPYIPDLHNLAFDAFVSFIVSALLAILINAEAQAFMATLLGDARVDAKDRFHFNVFFHLSLPGSICYLVGGFGWPKQIDLDTTKFAYPRLFTVIVRFSGAIANILLANIAASIIFVQISRNRPPGLFDGSRGQHYHRGLPSSYPPATLGGQHPDNCLDSAKIPVGKTGSVLFRIIPPGGHFPDRKNHRGGHHQSLPESPDFKGLGPAC